MARRGEQLREHILWAAKDVFIETGFERASMDAVAARAGTSKRSLYAHFEGKERLFLAVIDLVRGLFLARLGTPGDGGEPPADALATFCARYLEALLYEPSVRMCRVSMAEAERFPQGAARHFEIVLGEAPARLAAYLEVTFALPPGAAADAAEGLVARLLHPRLLRALFGLDELARSFAGEGSPPAVDPAPIRAAVADLIAALPDPGPGQRPKGAPPS